MGCVATGVVAGALAGVGLWTISPMRLSEELRRHVDRLSQDPLPPSWASEPALAEVMSFGELIGRLRRLDDCCDELLRALARLAEAGEPEACLVVTAALLPLLIARCGRRPSRWWARRSTNWPPV